MTLFESWKDSLKLCRWEAVKLMALVTLKTMKDVVVALSATWFVLPMAFIVGLATLFGGMQGFIGSISFVMSLASVFFIIAARPSVGIKDFEYFRHNTLRALWLLLVSMGLAILLMLPFFIPFIIANILLFIMPGFWELSILFYLDRTDSVWDAFKRAWRMIWYNYPLFVIYIGGVHIVSYLVLMPMSFFGFDIMQMEAVMDVQKGIAPFIIFIVSMWRMLFNLVLKCLIVNLYIKRVHDQSELYQ